MTTFDILTLALFAGLIVLFLERSVGETRLGDPIWRYLVAAVGCAMANYAGNEGFRLVAVLILIATLAYIFYVLKPLDRSGQG